MHAITKPMINVVRLFAQRDPVLGEERDVPLHGWQIARETGHAGPTVYGVIDRLEDQGWIEGEWEDLPPGENRPRRRYYRLTDKGREKAPLLLELQRELA